MWFLRKSNSETPHASIVAGDYTYLEKNRLLDNVCRSKRGHGRTYIEERGHKCQLCHRLNYHQLQTRQTDNIYLSLVSSKRYPHELLTKDHCDFVRGNLRQVGGRNL